MEAEYPDIAKKTNKYPSWDEVEKVRNRRKIFAELGDGDDMLMSAIDPKGFDRKTDRIKQQKENDILERVAKRRELKQAREENIPEDKKSLKTILGEILHKAKRKAEA